MIDLETFKSLAAVELENFKPKPTSLEGDQQEAATTLWQSPDGRLEVGVWECTPGRFTADRSTSTEICHFISGVVEMTDAEGQKRKLGAGDLLVLPRGWKGEWCIIERTRKLYLIQSD
ncbi:cupin domain-containing protein [Tianweitania sediminis]|jgi:hypothetical protein|uniref:Cupin domain-containing protein n=1 Tax=Tianweitania sediminis TaxID=1502156 RepID=A0A8J7ULK9_9HYPH|nr:cupin domain-containing protein [Tianweitania sediminis]MBP0441045.1 cupin domain-containing protein [Tianweitania sediminis]HEV7417840.1 cupin domain-containing protein [Tianweitania sediminis]